MEGSQTSHTAILARGLGIPAVVGCSADIIHLPNSSEAVLDGSTGKFIIDPSHEVVKSYQLKQGFSADLVRKAKLLCCNPAVTLDGHHVEIVANIGNLEGARTAIENGAEGVGLLRTEFLYMERETLPDERNNSKLILKFLQNLAANRLFYEPVILEGIKNSLISICKMK